MDYTFCDLKNSFTLREAAKAWCDVEVSNETNRNKMHLVFSAMVEACKTGELNIKECGSNHTQFVNMYWDCTVVTREDLIKWAKKMGQKPKFLFPEERNNCRLLEGKPEKDIDSREQITLLQIIRALALECAISLKNPHKAAVIVQEIAGKHGVTVRTKPDTIAAKLKKANELD